MPAENDAVNLQTMLDNAEGAVDLVDGRDFAEFDDDPELRFAVQYSIANAAEAASKISEATQARLPAIPWKKIIAMRAWNVDDNDNVEAKALWTALTDDLPGVIEQLLRFVLPPTADLLCSN